MKKLNLNILYAIVFLLLTLHTAFAKIDPEARGLITSEKYELKSLSSFQDILLKFHEDHPDRNIVFFVHGRDEEPSKEFHMLSTLEDRYNVKMIMLRWPAWSNFFTRPLENAKETAFDLQDLFMQLRDYKLAYPDHFADKNISAFFYSMGNIAFETFNKFNSNDFNGPNGEKLFNNVALLSADVGLYNHRHWLNKVDFAENIYVLMNNSDIVLNSSKLLDPENHRLGLGFNLIRRIIRSERDYLANNVNYLDLSGILMAQHAYYSLGTKNMIELLRPLYSGRKIDFDKISYKVKHKSGISYLSR